MIEVEKKFRLKAGDEERLIAGAEKVSEKSMTDCYYDLPDYSLTKKDWWLRRRDDRWELKIAVHDRKLRKRNEDQYDELEDEGKIREALALSLKVDLLSGLVEAGYVPFATIQTTRRKYRRDGFTIDLDTMDFGYEICEIEKMVHEREQADQAVEQILQFAQKLGLDHGTVRGKVLEYLFRKAPEHYKTLDETWGGIV